MDTVRGRRGQDERGEEPQHIDTTMYETASQREPVVPHRAQLCDDLEGQDGGDWEGGATGRGHIVHIAETNVRNQYHIVRQLYSN